MPETQIIYLDNCALQRPFDDRTQLRIDVEAEAILGIISLFEAHRIEILSSEALLCELRKAPDGERRSFGERLLGQSRHFIPINQDIIDKAKRIEQLGIKPWDSLHLASAVTAQANYFCSCDDAFLKKARTASTGLTKPVSVVELIE